jgi:hypothetical protein
MNNQFILEFVTNSAELAYMLCDCVLTGPNVYITQHDASTHITVQVSLSTHWKHGSFKVGNQNGQSGTMVLETVC